MTAENKSDTATPSPTSAGGAKLAAEPDSDFSAQTIALDQEQRAPHRLTPTLNPTSPATPFGWIGNTVDNRYFIEKELGRGGAGAVYLARDRKLHDKAVVIKILLEKSLQNSWVVQKFEQEKEALARVDHPGVVGILDNGKLPNRQPYIVMQYIDGVTLRSQIKPQGAALEYAAEVIKQIGRALAAAHEKGIFHRDLKPENIMLQRYGAGEEQVKIIDFGIAKLRDSVVAESTLTGATAGTVSYMSPEQLSGRGPVSAAMDIYAMGAIAYELVTGRKPFNPETGFELLEMQRAGVRVKPSDLRPSLSSEADEIILRALSFDPQQRFHGARELGDALARALSEETAPFAVRGAAPGAVLATQLATEANPPPRPTGELGPGTIATPFAPAQVDSLAQSPIAGLSVEEAPPSRSWLKITAGVVVLALIIAGAALVLLNREALFKNNAGANALPERSLAYSLTVQKMRDGKPYQGEFQSSGQEIFENGWKFRMNLTNPQEGYLYLLNEGPEAEATTFNVLFPEPETNSGSPRVSAGQNLQTAWMRFDDHQGTEKFWIVWTASPVKELEAVTGAVNETDQGEIKDSAKARTVRDFLQKHYAMKPEVAKDSAKKLTVVKGRGDVLVNMIELEHH